MTTISTPSAKSSCCGADVLPPGGIRKNPRESEMMKIVCDACGTESCWNGIAYCEKYRTAGIKKVPINCKHVPVQPAPDEGEMGKLLISLEATVKMALPNLDKEPYIHPPKLEKCLKWRELDSLLLYIRYLQSRLKQAEAERDSYRGDAERMMYTLRNYQSKNFEGSGVWAEECLSSLSSHYPSSK